MLLGSPSVRLKPPKKQKNPNNQKTLQENKQTKEKQTHHTLPLWWRFGTAEGVFLNCPLVI